MTARQNDKESRREKLVDALPAIALIVGALLVALIVVKTNELLSTYYAIRFGPGWIRFSGLVACVVVAAVVSLIVWFSQSDEHDSHKEP